ncbi:MAG TPA: pitrilysin family protein [Longimicrobiales bacterium]|nr:pitrilysin family protein [Longimicrobiales bacterium]
MSGVVRERAPEPGRLRPFEFPEVTRERLANGLTLLHARHGDLPLVTLSLVADAGGTEEADARAGLAVLTSNALASGTSSHSADEMAWAIELLGIHLDTHASWDAAFVRMTVPTERLEEAAALFADVVRNPSFPDEEITRLREQQLAGIIQRRKQPGTLAGDVAARTIFAPEVPWSRPLVGIPQAVRALTRDDVASFYATRFVPNTAALVVVGDIDPAEARALAERWFGDWTGVAPARREPATAGALDRVSIVAVDRPTAVQSEIRIGDVGVERTTPDYFPLLVMNTVLGGSFTSRLNMNLREKHGFTYGARSSFTMRRAPGPFMVATAVANDVTARAVQEALGEIGRLREHGATEAELAAARDYLSGVMPLQLQTTAALAGRINDLVIFDLPLDWFRKYRQRIAAVTADEVLRVARTRLRPDRFAVVVVGAAQEIVPPLEQLGIGQVRVVEIAE